MPNITVSIGNIPKEMKKELIVKVSAAAAEATNIPQEQFITYINEYPLENTGVGAKTLEEIHS